MKPGHTLTKQAPFLSTPTTPKNNGNSSRPDDASLAGLLVGAQNKVIVSADLWLSI